MCGQSAAADADAKYASGGRALPGAIPRACAVLALASHGRRDAGERYVRGGSSAEAANPRSNRSTTSSRNFVKLRRGGVLVLSDHSTSLG